MEGGTEHAIADGLANGWPLGLHLLSNARITNTAGTVATVPQETVHIRSISDVAGSYLASATSSVTSDSSSDLDTESTASFFPERSTTLGSLIGLQSRSQTPQRQTMIPIHQLVQEDRTLKRKNGRGGGASSMSRGGRALCPLLSCGSASLAQEEKMGMSPSLAHLLERERRSISGYSVEHANTLFDNEGILPPPTSGASLRLMLQQPHLDPPYISSDWHVYDNKAHDATSNHGLWPGLCFKQSTNLAN